MFFDILSSFVQFFVKVWVKLFLVELRMSPLSRIWGKNERLLMHGGWKSQKMSHLTLRAKRATFTVLPEMSILEYTRLDEKCQNCQKSKWDIFKNFQTTCYCPKRDTMLGTTSGQLRYSRPVFSWVKKIWVNCQEDRTAFWKHMWWSLRKTSIEKLAWEGFSV